MDKKNGVLFIFEGERKEPNFFHNIKKIYPEYIDYKFLCVCGNIYMLYNDISKDEDLDIVELIKSYHIPKNKKIFEEIERENIKISEIYMFFDFDGHDSKYNSEKLLKMLKLFDNETELGKLYISYPMIEAYTHLKSFDDEEFKNRICLIEDCGTYKKVCSDESCIKDPRKIKKEELKIIFAHNMKKMNYIVNNEYSELGYKEANKITQNNIFEKQVEKYIEVYKCIAVLSAIPLFFLNYFSEDVYNTILKN